MIAHHVSVLARVGDDGVVRLSALFQGLHDTPDRSIDQRYQSEVPGANLPPSYLFREVDSFLRRVPVEIGHHAVKHGGIGGWSLQECRPGIELVARVEVVQRADERRVRLEEVDVQHERPVILRGLADESLDGSSEVGGLRVALGHLRGVRAAEYRLLVGKARTRVVLAVLLHKRLAALYVGLVSL